MVELHFLSDDTSDFDHGGSQVELLRLVDLDQLTVITNNTVDVSRIFWV